jgi:aromatic ring-opening dioxygenase catalytic subunit (LigB family)
MYPAADVPLVQLSLNRNRDAAMHLAIGAALMPLRDQGVLIVGSGMSYHNLREIFVNRPEINQPSEDFDRWLNETVTESDPDVRAARLIEWRDAPGARASHPTPEHLLPLMVAAGAGGRDAGTRTYNDRLMGKAVSGFQFG